MILVVGATGELGGRVVRRLRDRSEAVSCLVRRQTAGDRIEAMGDDVAELITHVIAETDPPSVIEFGGPEAMSRNEAITLAEQFTGRTMKRQRMPRLLLRLAMRMLSKANPALASVFGLGLLQDLGLTRWDDAPLRERGIQARPTTEFLRAQAVSLGR